MYKLEDSFDLETKVVEREYLIKIKEEIISVTRGRLLRVKIRLVSRRMRKYLRFYTVANLANDHCAWHRSCPRGQRGKRKGNEETRGAEARDKGRIGWRGDMITRAKHVRFLFIFSRETPYA